MASCLPKQPGPSTIVYFDLLVDDNPALFSIKVFQVAVNLWYVEVYNRRTNVLAHRTDIQTTKQHALSDAKIWMAPYLKNELALA